MAVDCDQNLFTTVLEVVAISDDQFAALEFITEAAVIRPRS